MNNGQLSYDAVEMDSNTNRNRLRLLGLFWAILGGAAIAAAIVATLATMLIFGVLLLLAGVAQLAYVFSSQTSPDRGWQVATGVLYFLVGLLLVIDPVSGAIGLTLLIAILFLIRGIMQLAVAATYQRRGYSRGWHLLNGMLSLLLAVLIIAGWPETGTWVIGLFVGIELLLGGLTMLMTPKALAEKMNLG